MMLQSVPNYSTGQNWAQEYVLILDQKLNRSIRLLKDSDPANVRLHVRSFLTLLSESHRYAILLNQSLELISALHPFPLRWGLGATWEPELLFALEHTPADLDAQRSIYQCALGDLYMYRGQFAQAIEFGTAVLAATNVPGLIAARACRLVFLSLRSMGRSQEASRLIEQMQERFFANAAIETIPSQAAPAWLQFNQCQLELLREQGKITQALELVGQMIGLDQQAGCLDRILTAELLTHRSTLLWVQGQYQAAVQDLHQAIRFYQQEDHQFNGESLYSNLGLVYWTMGELDLAEQSLRRSIQYYRQTGSDHLLAYDIGNQGLVSFARGDVEDALRLTREHIELAQKLSFVAEYNRGRRNLGTILYYFGEYEQAIVELDACHAYYEKRGSRNAYMLDLVWLALCYAGLGEREKAVRIVREVLAWSQQQGAVVLEQITLRGLAYLLPREEQAPYLLRSLEIANASERKLEQAAVYLAFGAVGEDEKRMAYWQQGVQMMEEIGAALWLEATSPDQPPLIPLLL